VPRRYVYLVGVMAAVWPHMITLGSVALTETLFGFLLIAGVCLLIRALERSEPRAMIAPGILFAAAALVNQIAVGLIGLFCVALFCTKRKLAMCVFALVALGPAVLWTIRDSTISPPSGLSASGRLMENVLIGMEPAFAPKYMATGADPAAVAARARITAELDTFAHNKAEALGHIWQRIMDHPGEFLAWYVTKPARFWSWSIVQGANDLDVYPMIFAPFDAEAPLRVIASSCYAINGPLMLLALGGVLLVLSGRVGVRTHAHWIVVAVILYATVVHSILTPDVRYAVPFRPYEFILAVFALYMGVNAMLSIARRRQMQSRAPA
jgi:hypothetical protein